MSFAIFSSSYLAQDSNDTYGHDVGDLILKEMAFVFRKVAKDRGFVSRYGGDENSTS